MNRRLVIKVGSNVLTRADGTLDVTQMSSIVDQIADLKALGHEIILVSSGAVASGRSELRVSNRLNNVEQRQLYSAVGQVKLLNLYYDLFRERGLNIGQVLTMKENFATRREYLNQRACMEVMLQNDVIPIVNENDTVSVTELMFTDNDELSGLIASMLNADALIILSNVDGIYDGSPSDPASNVIPQLSPDADLSDFILPEKSGFGRGGMTTKCRIARRVAAEGILVCIANGRRPRILIDLLTNPKETVHTAFLPHHDGVSSVKKWIAHSSGFSKGTVRINAQAAQAILNPEKANSLLLVGVLAIDGDFEEGDIISILNENNQELGLGRSNYNSYEALQLLGQHNQRPLIHYDYLFLNESEPS